MNYINDKRIVMTLDAGGTNLVFSAIQGNEQIIDEIRIPSSPNDLTKMLNSLVEGFSEVKSKLTEEPVAISFAFPGPADYPNGIIGDLPNLPAFRGGVALGPFLESKFNLPVFINNDGDLYAYGEAISGFLPEINQKLKEAGSPKQYKNLVGLTLGTGFGAGIVRDGELFIGDNSGAGEIWLLRDKLSPMLNIEEHGSIRGIRKIYSELSNTAFENTPEPKELFEIAKGEKEGNKEAAIKAFKDMAEACGDAISNAITLIDGLVVIGGGLSGASDVFLPFLVDEMNGSYTNADGTQFRRLVQNVYNLESETELTKFLKGSTREIVVFGTDKTIKYDPDSRLGVGISKIGTSKAISLGAYAFALNMLSK
ncbi:MAG: ROK family protein [Bacteroidetes bacterium]|nr:ROK family protein [Bacteroidota bacterium]MBU1116957.1 ROK family protein [Bacteroidota bacterium]MBU1799130.1 ROK family protein [Bacteroidota bacterium]